MRLPVWKWKLEAFGQIALTTEEPGMATGISTAKIFL